MSFDKDSEIYIILRRNISNFAYPPGSQLIIGSIANNLRVSQTPVRESLFRLAAEDLVDCIHGRGFFVKPPDQKYYSYYLKILLFLITGAAFTLISSGRRESLEIYLQGRSRRFDEQTKSGENLADIFSELGRTLFGKNGIDDDNTLTLFENIVERMRFIFDDNYGSVGESKFILIYLNEFLLGILQKETDNYTCNLASLLRNSELVMSRKMKSIIIDLHEKHLDHRLCY